MYGLNAICMDGKKRLCHIRGALRHNVWIELGDIVLVSLQDFQDRNADLIHRYTEEIAQKLRMYGELPATAKY
jgi:translation initiation factor 1A